jgi:mannan endo-1,4-beta-mannosidase
MVRVLRTRSHGDDVAFVQEQLNARPPTALPPLAVDGVFGPRTLCRVKEFQTTTGLTASGIVGRATWGKLLGYTAATTPGFCVLGRHLYDRLGTRVLLRGVNKMSVWDNEDPDGATSFGEIRQTGANTVRIVWAMTTDLSPNGPATSLSALDVLLTNAKGNHLIPMIELHDATCQWGRLDDLVRYWTQPATVAVVTKHQAYVLVNIGNEVGDDTVTQAEFVAGYAAAIRRLRGAGIHTPLVIDAPDCGKDLAMLNACAASLLATDPDHNLLFSIHLYWPLSCGYDAAAIRAQLQQAVRLAYPLVVGEFSRYGGEPCGAPGATNCSPAGEIDYAAILDACQALELGWYAWEWGPGNEYGDPPCPEMNMTPDRLSAHLAPGWASDVAVTHPFSIQHTSVTPASM